MSADDIAGGLGWRHMFRFRLRTIFLLTMFVAAAVALYTNLRLPHSRWEQMVVLPRTPVRAVLGRGAFVRATEPEIDPMVIRVSPAIDPQIVITPKNVDPNMPMHPGRKAP